MFLSFLLRICVDAFCCCCCFFINVSVVELSYEESPGTTGQVAVNCPRMSKRFGIYNTDSSFMVLSLMHVCLCACDHFPVARL